MFRAIFLSSMFMCLLAYGQFYFISFLFESYYIFYPPILCVSIWTEIRFIFFSLAAIKKRKELIFMSDCLLSIWRFLDHPIFLCLLCPGFVCEFFAPSVYIAQFRFFWVHKNMQFGTKCFNCIKIKSKKQYWFAVTLYSQIPRGRMRGWSTAHFETKTYKQTKTQKECRQLVQKPYQICK